MAVIYMAYTREEIQARTSKLLALLKTHRGDIQTAINAKLDALAASYSEPKADVALIQIQLEQESKLSEVLASIEDELGALGNIENEEKLNKTYQSLEQTVKTLMVRAGIKETVFHKGMEKTLGENLTTLFGINRSSSPAPKRGSPETEVDKVPPSPIARGQGKSKDVFHEVRRGFDEREERLERLSTSGEKLENEGHTFVRLAKEITKEQERKAKLGFLGEIAEALTGGQPTQPKEATKHKEPEGGKETEVKESEKQKSEDKKPSGWFRKK